MSDSPSAAASQAGLTGEEAARRLAEVGPNDPAPKQKRSQLTELLLQFANPLVAILLFASVVSAFVGELVNAAIIIVIVSLSVAVNFVTFRSQAAAERLRAAVAPTATALRDGAFKEVPRVSVVPGDVVRLCAGDLVPADARLLRTTDLHLQESALTGESMPVEKEAKAGDESPATLVLLGTSVVSGTATALVLATGTKTQFGDIATRLQASSSARNRVRPRAQAVWVADHEGRVRSGDVHSGSCVLGTHRSAFESVLFGGRLGCRTHPRVPADDHVGDSGPRRSRDGKTKSHRQAPVGDSESRQHRRTA